jgi:DNA-binding LytR/AlgR family response regulator
MMHGRREKFVSGGRMQLALRELRALSASKNLWLTFAAIVLLFAFTGPFGTMDQLRFLPRLAYWLGLHLMAWTAALVCAVLGNVLLINRISVMFWRMMIGAIAAAVPIGLITQFTQLAWFGIAPRPSNILSDILLAVPLCVIFCTISYMTMATAVMDADSGAAPSTEATLESSQTQTAPLMRRLRPENRGVLQHLAVEDHYTVVHTSLGRELLLLRFSDAIAEVGTTPGLRVHRSHWVADHFVAGLHRADGRLVLRLADGSEVPVSRTYAGEVRARFG